MSIVKSGILAATSAVGLLGAAPAHAQFYSLPAAQPVQIRRLPRMRVRWHRPAYRYEAPVYQTAQPIYESYYEDNFASHVSFELGQIEESVRARVMSGELDGSALTSMESSRNDIQEDVADVSAKGFIAPADRAHIEGDVQALRQKFGC